jgi:hypothetical protein
MDKCKKNSNVQKSISEKDLKKILEKKEAQNKALKKMIDELDKNNKNHKL